MPMDPEVERMFREGAIAARRKRRMDVACQVAVAAGTLMYGFAALARVFGL